MIEITDIEITQDDIDVTHFARYVPDPDWVFVDSDGNEHRWHFDEKGKASTPTLAYKEVELPSICDECGHAIEGEIIIDQWMEAPTGERVMPGTKPEPNSQIPNRQFMPGPKYWGGTFSMSSGGKVPSIGSKLQLEDCTQPDKESVLSGTIVVTEFDFIACVGRFEGEGDVCIKSK